MVKKQIYMTREGVGELEQEYAKLIIRRKPIAERIKTAREFGDLAENAEYTSARQEQERVEGRIAEIDHILSNATVIKKPKAANLVQLGSIVKLAANNGKSREFQIVGTVEADPLSGKISDESPIGRILMGRKVGESIELQTTLDLTIFKIIDVA